MEVEHTAVGFLSISTELDTKTLKECYDLSLFDNLCTPTLVEKEVTVTLTKEESKAELEKQVL